MKTSQISFGILTIAMALLGRTTAFGQTNLIINGSFEEPTIASINPSVESFGVNWYVIPGWTSSPSNSILISYGPNDVVPSPVDGDQLVIFNAGCTPSGNYLEQIIPTVIGLDYELSYYVGHGGGGGGDMAIEADLFDSSTNIIASITGHDDVNGNNFNTAPTVLNFTAITSSTRLRLTDVSTDACASDCMLDEVIIIPLQIIPSINWTNPAPITYGTTLSSNQLNATANVPGIFAYTPTNGTVLNPGTNTLTVVFTPIDTVDYSTVTDSVSLVVLTPQPIINIQKAVYLISTNMLTGLNYQVQASSDLINWTNQGCAFTATNSNWQSTNYWNVNDWNQLFFQLQVVPSH
jgi:hypothetical protein